jgi:hypothetical protein
MKASGQKAMKMTTGSGMRLPALSIQAVRREAGVGSGLLIAIGFQAEKGGKRAACGVGWQVVGT